MRSAEDPCPLPRAGSPLPCTRPPGIAIPGSLLEEFSTEGQEPRGQSYPGRSPILRSASQRTAVRGDEEKALACQEGTEGQPPGGRAAHSPSLARLPFMKMTPRITKSRLSLGVSLVLRAKTQGSCPQATCPRDRKPAPELSWPQQTLPGCSQGPPPQLPRDTPAPETGAGPVTPGALRRTRRGRNRRTAGGTVQKHLQASPVLPRAGTVLSKKSPFQEALLCQGQSGGGRLPLLSSKLPGPVQGMCPLPPLRTPTQHPRRLLLLDPAVTGHQGLCVRARLRT